MNMRTPQSALTVLHLSVVGECGGSEQDQSTKMAIIAKLKNAPTSTLSTKVIGNTLRAGAMREDMTGGGGREGKGKV